VCATLELWLVRHGQTTYGAERRLAGWSNPPLTAQGRGEAARLHSFLAEQCFDGVIASDLNRCAETAKLAWGGGAATPDPRIREMCFGTLEGCLFAELEPAQATALLAFREYAAPGGETMAELRARLTDFATSLHPGRYLVFTHGGVIRCLTQQLGDDRFVPTCTVVGLVWHPRELLFIREPADAEQPFSPERS